ncbi:hypothetical protein B0T18DRAFT_427642 [Schizothecium vesticola]|uniref:DUF3494 domain-containing protein n=1 Tax=Schizothecium vesticola TaxID=314040 RepID=A0AA40K855_9PEZI|nr:hypothetical protein B0T18DRAFT_427642 [Schizothecium vesticola]
MPTTLRLLTLACVLAGSINAQLVNLGSALPFAVLGGSAVTNTGTTTLVGSLGVSPGNSITGNPTVVGGSVNIANAVASQAQLDVTTAYNDAASRTSIPLTGNLGGRVLAPGVYSFSSSAFLTGTLLLDAQGAPDSVWIFKTGSTLITAATSTVAVINGGVACNVFWKVGSSATLGTGTTFIGNILALESITVGTGATNNGSLYARTGAVTLISNAITHLPCPAPPLLTTTSSTTSTTTPATDSSTTSPTTSTPDPSTTTTHRLEHHNYGRFEHHVNDRLEHCFNDHVNDHVNDRFNHCFDHAIHFYVKHHNFEHHHFEHHMEHYLEHYVKSDAKLQVDHVIQMAYYQGRLVFYVKNYRLKLLQIENHSDLHQETHNQGQNVALYHDIHQGQNVETPTKPCTTTTPTICTKGHGLCHNVYQHHVPGISHPPSVGGSTSTPCATSVAPTRGPGGHSQPEWDHVAPTAELLTSTRTAAAATTWTSTTGHGAHPPPETSVITAGAAGVAVKLGGLGLWMSGMMVLALL